MLDLSRISPEFAKDLIELVNSLGDLQKTASVSYGATRFHYVPLDDILARIKNNQNFAFMQPLGIMEDGIPCIKCLLIHKSGEFIVSDPYPLRIKDGAKKQDEGAEITYSRRYCAASFFGIASDEDTDANNGGNPSRKATRHNPPKPITNETGEQINALIKQYREISGDDYAIKRMEAKIGKDSKDFCEDDGKRAIKLLNGWIKYVKANGFKTQGA